MDLKKLWFHGRPNKKKIVNVPRVFLFHSNFFIFNFIFSSWVNLKSNLMVCFDWLCARLLRKIFGVQLTLNLIKQY